MSVTQISDELVTRFLKMSTLHTKFTAETNLADEELERVMENGEEIWKLRGRIRIPIASKDVGENFVSPLTRMQIQIIILLMAINR